MIKNLCFIIGINLLVLNQAKAFEVLKKDLYVSPSISIGYTFFAKINYGFSLDFGVRKQNSDKKKHSIMDVLSINTMLLPVLPNRGKKRRIAYIDYAPSVWLAKMRL